MVVFIRFVATLCICASGSVATQLSLVQLKAQRGEGATEVTPDNVYRDDTGEYSYLPTHSSCYTAGLEDLDATECEHVTKGLIPELRGTPFSAIPANIGFSCIYMSAQDAVFHSQSVGAKTAVDDRGRYICKVPSPAPTLAPTPPVTPAPTSCEDAGTCTLSEDPHIDVFDGAHVSLLSSFAFTKKVHSEEDLAGDMWVVKSDRVSIQARLMPNEDLPDRNLFVRAIAVGGAFLKGNTIVVGSLEDQITFNGQPILIKESSTFDLADEEGLLLKATRGNQSSLVQDLSMQNQGVNLNFTSGVNLVVNRLHQKLNVAITMPPQKGGQDGLCGNFNGLAVDDALELSSTRFEARVETQDSLFVGLNFD